MTIAPPLQRGFAAVAAIFLVVVLAALGGFMLSFSNSQQLSSVQDMQGSRAYWVARSGLEWGMAAVLASAPVAPAVTPLPSCPGTTAAPTPLEGFTLTVHCIPQTFNEAGVTRTIFRLEAIASAGGAVGSISYVERSVSASLEL